MRDALDKLVAAGYELAVCDEYGVPDRFPTQVERDRLLAIVRELVEAAHFRAQWGLTRESADRYAIARAAWDKEGEK